MGFDLKKYQEQARFNVKTKKLGIVFFDYINSKKQHQIIEKYDDLSSKPFKYIRYISTITASLNNYIVNDGDVLTSKQSKQLSKKELTKISKKLLKHHSSFIKYKNKLNTDQTAVEKVVDAISLIREADLKLMQQARNGLNPMHEITSALDNAEKERQKMIDQVGNALNSLGINPIEQYLAKEHERYEQQMAQIRQATLPFENFGEQVSEMVSTVLGNFNGSVLDSTFLLGDIASTNAALNAELIENYRSQVESLSEIVRHVAPSYQSGIDFHRIAASSNITEFNNFVESLGLPKWEDVLSNPHVFDDFVDEVDEKVNQKEIKPVPDEDIEKLNTKLKNIEEKLESTADKGDIADIKNEIENIKSELRRGTIRDYLMFALSVYSSHLSNDCNLKSNITNTNTLSKPDTPEILFQQKEVKVQTKDDNGKLCLHYSPQLTSESRCEIKNQTILTVLEEREGWLLVRYLEQNIPVTGWVVEAYTVPVLKNP